MSELQRVAIPGNHMLTSPEQVEKVEKKGLELPQVECPVSHYFGPGIYIREVRIPAGTFSIGHHQNVEHLNHMTEGKVVMLNSDGTTSEIEAPAIFTTGPGRKVGFIIEDMVWHNIYPTDETDVDKLEATYLTKSDTWIGDHEEKANLDYVSHHADREDYKKMLADIGVSRETVVEQSENLVDQISMPSGCKVRVSDSNIQGKGLFAIAPIGEGQVISPARVGGKRTPAGRYTNHSLSPNAKMVKLDNGDIDLMAIKNVQGCLGGGHGEEITIDYRQAYSLHGRALCQA